MEDYVECMENKHTKAKTQRDVKLVNGIFKKREETRNDEREVHTIAPAELNQYLAEFIRSVRRKDGKAYKPLRLIEQSEHSAFRVQINVFFQRIGPLLSMQ